MENKQQPVKSDAIKNQNTDDNLSGTHAPKNAQPKGKKTDQFPDQDLKTKKTIQGSSTLLSYEEFKKKKLYESQEENK